MWVIKCSYSRSVPEELGEKVQTKSIDAKCSLPELGLVLGTAQSVLVEQKTNPADSIVVALMDEVAMRVTLTTDGDSCRWQGLVGCATA